MEFTITEHFVFVSKPVFQDSFFIHPLQDMGDDFKGFEINPHSNDLTIYDSLIWVLEGAIRSRRWDIEGRRSRISINGDYALMRGNDVRILAQDIFLRLSGIIIQDLIEPYILNSASSLTYDDEKLERTAHNYVEWQLDKFLDLETSDHGIKQKLSDN